MLPRPHREAWRADERRERMPRRRAARVSPVARVARKTIGSVSRSRASGSQRTRELDWLRASAWSERHVALERADIDAGLAGADPQANLLASAFAPRYGGPA